MISGVWDTDTGWIDDKQYCINLRYETILKIARHEYNPHPLKKFC